MLGHQIPPGDLLGCVVRERRITSRVGTHDFFPFLGVSCLVPSEVTYSWIERHQQIYPGETLCGLLVPWVHGDLLEGRDLLSFVDNEAAVSSLIKGSSGQEDVHTKTIVQLAHLISKNARFDLGLNGLTPLVTRPTGCPGWVLRTNGPKPNHGDCASCLSQSNYVLLLGLRIFSLSSPY